MRSVSRKELIQKGIIYKISDSHKSQVKGMFTETQKRSEHTKTCARQRFIHFAWSKEQHIVLATIGVELGQGNNAQTFTSRHM